MKRMWDVGLGLVAVAIAVPCAVVFAEDVAEVYRQRAQLLDAWEGDPSVWETEYAFYETLANKQPHSPYGYLGMSRVIRVGANLSGKGLPQYDQTKLRDQALPLALKAESLGADVPEVYTNLSSIYEGLGRREEAFTAAHKAVALGPTLPATHIQLGYLYFAKDDVDSAATEFQSALKLGPTPTVRAPLLEHLGGIAGMKRDYAQALSYYEEAFALEPKAWWLVTNIGLAYMGLRQFEQAIDAFHRALELMPSEATKEIKETKEFLHRAEQELRTSTYQWNSE